MKKWAIVCGMLLLCGGAFFAASFQISNASRPAMADYRYRPKVIIDAGHGGFDGGAVGAGGIVEKGINLAIAQNLKTYFTWGGFEVLMTREADVATNDEGVTGIHKQKVSDLNNRLELMEENPDAIVLSIHQNKFEDASCWGTQVFYGTKQQEASQLLAQIIQDNTRALLQPENVRECKEAYSTLYLLNNAPSPTVLVECGFLSNPAEGGKLTRTDYQRQMAYVIYTSTMEFLTKSNTSPIAGSGTGPTKEK